ncbi:FdhF/YdeP family oxidoreductase [Thalassotalea agarivorans]|uniref:Oxidoreductase alpha (Molybdopterin) subunit n=1 Tax=Thalassotalea agarivorans TaxID=349064 RepID=A0A1I0CBV3_THASX|nr:FdhF/YdeP family oxidoreductase [Thalassotalea agarivorans]SET16907.1 oxidoreductase alpha (molybdopterin) subunit [Thalassotalea agarivorans]
MAKEQVIGGGFKKVLYTLDTVRKMGPLKAAKALKANNTCKACGLGMGGQLGGMTNELGEFPSVCNKSVQAQSSDVQAAIPHEIFDHSLAELRELDGYELEHLGRLTSPIYKGAGEQKYRVIDWQEALDIAVKGFQKTEAARSFFYSSGRSSNEAGFIFQLFARLYGSNNVTNCSYYCHQATSVALGSTIGTGTATVELADLNGCDLVFVVGANPSSNHPRFIHKLKAVRERGGDVIVINPAKEAGLVKFAVPKSPKSLLKGGDEIASHYLQPNIGSDVAVMIGLAKAVLSLDAQDDDFIKQSSTGYQAFLTSVEQVTWHQIENESGLSQAQLEAVAACYAKSKNAVFAWGMGLTHHTNGVENIEALINLALLRGMVGKQHAGLLPLRGHSNVQGIGTIGVKPVLAETVIENIEQQFNVQLPKTEGMHTLACLQAAERGEMDAALILGGNLYEATPDSAFAGRALDAVPFKVFLTTTINAGHIHGVDGESLIIPVTARDEEWSPTTQESMFNFVRLSDGGIIRHTNIRPESVVLADIADGVLIDSNFSFAPFKDHKKTRQAIAEIVPGMEQLKDIDVAKQEFHIKGRILHRRHFNTPDNNAHFQAVSLPQHEVSNDFPFKLSTLRSEGQFNSIIYEYKDSYRQTDERWAVMMNAKDIASLGLTEGGRANLTSANGEMKGVKVFAFDVPEGNFLSYYPEANVLTGLAIDPRSKTPAFKHVAVNISPANGA